MLSNKVQLCTSGKTAERKMTKREQELCLPPGRRIETSSDAEIFRIQTRVQTEVSGAVGPTV